ncbi:DUF2860 domain-containing protein [Vibrio sp. JC009]|uniref:DUF2860 family protein n=1 Tax=Vibrio sp. JC009 TaxID=2912314 RepID=UPI0023B16317|nr:DUF2860 family protein [Vibrio sp. JC009]WED23026.1 DUF2860 domain-containing protein [Vibrio sp. JC009]
MTKTFALFAAIVVSSSANANPEEGRFDQQGFSGDLSLMTGYFSSKNNLDTETKVKSGELNSEATSESKFAAAPFGKVAFTYGSQQVFMGMTHDNIVEGVFALEFGYAFELRNHSALAFSYFPTISKGEVWENPYLVNTARTKTDLSGNAYRIQYERIAGLPINTDFTYYDKEVENELSGSSSTINTQSLRRDGTGYQIAMSSGLPISQSFLLMPKVSYHIFDADGRAMAFEQYDVDLQTMYRVGSQAISLAVSYSNANFDAENPLFNIKREDTKHGVSLNYKYRDLFGWHNCDFSIMAAYNDSDSNIDFYDQNKILFGLGLNYKF